jgi:acetylglutamate synthase
MLVYQLRFVFWFDFFSAGAIALMQLQEDLKKHLSAECNYTEEDLEAYMKSHKSVMVDSLLKLIVADIEATLSRVCQMVHPHILTPLNYSGTSVFVFILHIIISCSTGFKYSTIIRCFKIAVLGGRN